MKYKVLGYIFITAVMAATVSLLYYVNVKNSVPENVLLPVHKDATANWKTYTNDKYGFEFKYPQEWTVGDTSTGAGYSVFEYSVYPNYDLNKNYGAGPLLQIYLDKRSLTEYLANTNFSNKLNYTLDGKKGFVVNFPEKIGLYRPIYIFEKDGKAFVIIINITEGTDIGMKEVNQILSTFKFTDSNSSTSTTGTLSGHVTVGPVCPVERESVPCPVPPEAYTSRQVGVFTLASAESEMDMDNNLIASQHFDAKGNYKFSLAPGTYTIKASGMRVDKLDITIGRIIIYAGQTATVDFNIDTGIR